jgi:mannose-1-phosphate guanylyltransferase/mannose-6-phosphate isomerase
MIVPVILSGGEGRRLWPLSSPNRPKQFLSLAGEETLLQQTVRRLSEPKMFDAPIIVAGVGQRFLIAEQLRLLDLGPARIVLEPVARNTAPALAAGALLAAAGDADALILSSHADHAIPDTEAFRAAVARGLPAAQAGRLVLFGVEPTFPASAYGYIEPAAKMETDAFGVRRFVEKPAPELASRMIAAGALWNSGIFLMRAASLIAEFEIHAPEVLAAVREAISKARADEDFFRLDSAAFARAPAIAIDHAIMEKTRCAAVVAAQFAWSDIGSWSAVWDANAHDENGNAAAGPIVLDDVRDSLIYSEGPRIAACGVSDLIVVATSERVLVVPRAADQRVRDLGARADDL